MRLDAVSIGNNPPSEVNVIIEVPVGGEPIKYEMDKEAGTLFVDRFLYTPMRYPANYGFVPHTLSPDGDPLDALVIARSPFIPGCVVRARPIAHDAIRTQIASATNAQARKARGSSSHHDRFRRCTHTAKSVNGISARLSATRFMSSV